MNAPCPHCGNRQNPPGATKCRACGKPLSTGSPGAITPRGGGGLNLNPVLVDASGRKYTLSVSAETFIGSRGCAIPVAGAQPRHARLFVAGGCMQIEALAGAVVLVNQKATSGITALQANDQVTIGNMVLTYLPGSAPLPQGQPLPGAAIIPAQTGGQVQVPPVVTPPAPRPQQGDLEGEVRFIDGPFMEDEDMTTGRFLGKLISFGLALWKPAFIMIGQHHRQVPVRYVRVEDFNQQIRVVKMKGEISTGIIGTGDHVIFWGRWDGGTLIMQRGFNQTTNTVIGLRQ